MKSASQQQTACGYKGKQGNITWCFTFGVHFSRLILYTVPFHI